MRKAKSNAARYLSRQSIGFLPAGCQLDAGCVADHPEVEELLAEVHSAQAREAFRAALEEPSYEPNDRLLIRCDGRLAGHVLLSPRQLMGSTGSLPASHISWLVTGPEYRRKGLASHLLEAARQQMLARRSVMATAWCQQPQFLAHRGWQPWLQRRFRYDDPRHIVSRLGEADAGPVSVRHWRRCEAAALVQLHQGRAMSSWGAFERSETMWQWHTAHNRFDRIYVAVNGPERRRGGPEFEPLLGYLVLRGDCIVEHAWENGQEHVAHALLARVCHDAIERNVFSLGIMDQPDDPLLGYFAAGGQTPCKADGSALMIHLLDAAKLLRLMTPMLQQAARDADELPRELGVDIAGLRGHWVLERRRARFLEGRSRTYLLLGPSELLALALGTSPASRLIEQGRLRASNRTAARVAETLFPGRPAWVSPLDDLMF